MDRPFEPVHDEQALSHMEDSLLASGLRRGELLAVTFRRVTYPSDHSHITPCLDQAFISKTRNKTGHTLQPYVIQCLRPLLGKEKDRTLSHKVLVESN